MSMTIGEAYKIALARLESAGVENAGYEALEMLQKAFSLTRAGFMIHKSDEADWSKTAGLYNMTAERAEGEPLQYVLGEWSFMGFPVKVGRGVLIPRPDTEVLVNLCGEFLRGSAGKSTLDLCSGSGAIAIALEKLYGARVTAVELDKTAFGYLKTNLELNRTSAQPVLGDALKIYKTYPDSTFDLIASNPPYIKTEDIKTLQSEVHREPVLALDGGRDGCDFYRAIVNLWSSKLRPGGAMAFELGEGQADYVRKIMTAHGFTNIKTARDLGGTQRAIVGIKSKT